MHDGESSTLIPWPFTPNPYPKISISWQWALLAAFTCTRRCVAIAHSFAYWEPHGKPWRRILRCFPVREKQDDTQSRLSAKNALQTHDRSQLKCRNANKRLLHHEYMPRHTMKIHYTACNDILWEHTCSMIVVDGTCAVRTARRHSMKICLVPTKHVMIAYKNLFSAWLRQMGLSLANRQRRHICTSGECATQHQQNDSPVAVLSHQENVVNRINGINGIIAVLSHWEDVINHMNGIIAI